MRVSTNLMALKAVDAMLTQQSDLSKTQLQISLGKRILSPADDPYGSSRSLDLEEVITIYDQYQENGSYAENRLEIMEGNLQAVNTALQRIRELTVNASNDSQTEESRRFISEEVRQLADQLLSLANATDASNEYLYSGWQGKTKPFVPNSATGQVDYFGDEGQRFLKIGPSTQVPVSDSGADVFRYIRNGNGDFQTVENPANIGTGIIDPGTVIGTYNKNTYSIKFMNPSAPTNPENGPKEYYVLDEDALPLPTIVVPAAYAGVDEATYLADVANTLVTFATGVPYEEGALIEGINDPLIGIQTYITGDPATPAGGPPAPPGVAGDTFTISPSEHQDIFTTVDNLIDALTGPMDTDANRTHFHNAINRVLVDLDQGMGSILDTRARIGARLNTVDKQAEVNESFKIQNKKTLSDIQDLDYASAVTELNIQLVGLQAAQQAYSKVQGLSLFNYL